MTTVKIKLQSVEQVKEFVQTVSTSPYDIDIASGRYVVDAKSILGIFSLDMEKTMELIIHGNNCQEILEKLESFIID